MLWQKNCVNKNLKIIKAPHGGCDCTEPSWGFFCFGNENKIQNFTVSGILILQFQDHSLIIIQDYRILCDFQRRIVVKKNFFI